MIFEKYTVSFEGELFEIWIDGAGLDMTAGDEFHEFYCEVVETYSSIGLEKAIEEAGGVIIMSSKKVAI